MGGNFSSRQIRGYRSQLVSGINYSLKTGDPVQVDLTTARALEKICARLERIEKSFEEMHEA